MIAVGDTVRLKPFYGREAVVSSLTEDTVWVSLLVGRQYNLYPYDYEDVEPVAFDETQERA